LVYIPLSMPVIPFKLLKSPILYPVLFNTNLLPNS
jgi:hypothetical protein